MDTVRRGLRGHPRAAGLRRRAGRRPGQGLLPDRHRPVRGAAGDQPGQDGGRPRDRGLRAVRLPRLGPARRCDQAQVDRELDELYKPRRALVAAAQQVRQPAHRRALRQRPDRRADQRRQPAERRLVLERARPAPGPLHDNTIETGSRRRAARCSTRCSATLGVPSGTLPAYPPAPHCNTRGLTDARRAHRSSG